MPGEALNERGNSFRPLVDDGFGCLDQGKFQNLCGKTGRLGMLAGFSGPASEQSAEKEIRGKGPALDGGLQLLQFMLELGKSGNHDRDHPFRGGGPEFAKSTEPFPVGQGNPFFEPVGVRTVDFRTIRNRQFRLPARLFQKNSPEGLQYFLEMRILRLNAVQGGGQLVYSGARSGFLFHETCSS